MKKEKLYFTRYHDQWKGKDIAIVENETNVYELLIQIPDTDISEGSVNTIIATFYTKEGILIEKVGCEIYDSSKRMIKLQVPLTVLANDGLYKVDFSISYNKNGSNKTDEKTVPQTFTILESVEISDKELENDDRYDVLQKLIDDLAQYKVDTSNFASKEEVQEMIDKATEGLTIETIKSKLEGVYVTPDQMTKRLEGYQTTFGMGEYAKTRDIENTYVKTKYLNENILPYYAKKDELSKYVIKEQGKSLTSNDFTDALRDKLINMPSTGAEFDDSELKRMISEKADMSWVVNRFENLNTINEENFYNKEQINEQINNINNTHEEDISNIEEELPTFLKKEDYQYADGINTDDVNFNEKTLTEILNELSYKEIEIKSFNSTLISHLYEFNVGRVNSITLKWELNRNPISQTISNYNGTLTVNDREITINNPITSNTDFILKVVDEKGVEKSATVSLKFVFPSYYGVYEDTLDVDSALRGNKIIIDNKNTTIDMSYNNKKVFFALPYEVKDIKDNNGLSYFNDFIHDELYMNGTRYNVYKLDDRATVKNISYSLIFEKEEE